VATTSTERGNLIDATAFTLTHKSDIAAVGRPDRAVVRSRVGRQAEWFTGADQLHVYVGAILFAAIPRKGNQPAVGREGGLGFAAGEAGHRNNHGPDP